MQEATSPENFVITKATRLFAVGWRRVYDVNSTNRNLSESKLQNFISNFTNSLIARINFYGIK